MAGRKERPLSPRLQQIAKLMEAGKGPREIARELAGNPGTIKSQMKTIRAIQASNQAIRDQAAAKYDTP